MTDDVAYRSRLAGFLRHNGVEVLETDDLDALVRKLLKAGPELGRAWADRAYPS